MRAVYRAADEKAALDALSAFEDSEWGQKYPPMRLLIINPNTSVGVTERVRAAAEAVAMPGDEFTTTSAAFGPELIVTVGDTRQVVEGVKATVDAHAEYCDGIVLASFGDTGAREVRSMRPGLPVIGIASAAFLTV